MKALLFVLLAAGLLLVAYWAQRGQRMPRRSLLPPPSASAARERLLEQLERTQQRREPDVSLAQSAVAELRRRRLSIPPLSSPAGHIAASGRRIGRVTSRGLVVDELGSDQPLHLALPHAELVVGSPLGLLAVGRESMLLLDRRQQKPQRFARVPLFPGSRVLADLIDRNRVWVSYPGTSKLYGYALDADAQGLLPIVQEFELHAEGASGLLPLADGSFIYRAASGWERFFPQGKRFQLDAPPSSSRPVRLLRARRIDQLFVLYADARVERLQIQERLRVLWSRQLDRSPVDIVSTGNTLIALSTRHERDPGLVWELQVFASDSPEPRRIELGPSDPGSFNGDWVARQLNQHGLVASNDWVAVGGPERLRVWDLESLELLLDRKGDQMSERDSRSPKTGKSQ